ncbi:hypothetical protein ACWGLI_31635 [Kitasatospora sp. NPDC054769]|uniref:hypothetical protein n=1 Tax=Kitasatospora sp. NBC_01519 TaxID=2903576 RepID=UPI002F912FED
MIAIKMPTESSARPTPTRLLGQVGLVVKLLVAQGLGYMMLSLSAVLCMIGASALV